MVKDKIVAIINGAGPKVANSLFHFFSAKEEAEITKDTAERYGEIAEEMRKERGRSEEVVEEKQKELSEVGKASVSMMRKYLETEKVEHLRDAKTAIEPACPSCAKNIQTAIDAIEDGNEEKAKEMIYGILGSLTVSTKGMNF